MAEAPNHMSPAMPFLRREAIQQFDPSRDPHQKLRAFLVADGA